MSPFQFLMFLQTVENLTLEEIRERLKKPE